MMLIWFAVGSALGVLNTLAQWWTVHQLRPNAAVRAASLTVAGAVVRLALTAAILLFAFQDGLAFGLAGLAGLWLARWLVLFSLSKAQA